MRQPEEHARQTIDYLLATAGGYDCAPGNARISARQGVSLREFSLTSGHGCVDFPSGTTAVIESAGMPI